MGSWTRATGFSLGNVAGGAAAVSNSKLGNRLSMRIRRATQSVRLRIAYPSESADEPFERAFGGKMGKRWVKVAGERDLGGRGNNLILNDECHS